MRPCGCILSARALREVEASAKAEARRTANNNNDDNNTSSDTNGTAAATGLSCAQCGTALASTDDIVPLNRPKEEYEEAQRVILQRQETLRLEVRIIVCYHFITLFIFVCCVFYSLLFSIEYEITGFI